MRTYEDDHPAVRRLMEAVRTDLEAATEHLDQTNVGIARSWIEAALRKLPKEHDGIDAPWPTTQDFEQDARYPYTPEYARIVADQGGP